MVISSKTYNQELCLGRVKALCVLQHWGKKIKKLKTHFALRLRNRGFKKYTLMKLFSKITYSQKTLLSQMYANPLPFRKQRGGWFWTARGHTQVPRKKSGTRQLPLSRPSTPSTASTTTARTTQQTQTTGRKLAAIQGLLLPKVGSLSFPLPGFSH